MLNRKLKKLITKPNLFFYDYFAKKIGVQTANAAGRTMPWDSSQASLFTAEQLAHATPWQLLNSLIGWRSGALTGMPDQSFLLLANELNLFIAAILEIAEFNQWKTRIFTLGGGYFQTVGPGGDAAQSSASAIVRSLSSKPDFVVELSGGRGLDFALHVFIYEVAESEQYVVRSSQAYVKKLPISRLADIYPAPLSSDGTRYQPRTGFPIDAVYTWVNRDDPSWQALWNGIFPATACDPDRFTCNDELKYSLRALMKYVPWIRCVYVVTNCAKPAYLASSSKLVWLDHRAIFPDPAVLPTFNSHAIEASLHRIPDLAEHFLYLNDDVFINQPCYPRQFFDEFGRSIAYLEPYGMVTDDPPDLTTADYLVAAKNCRQLLRQSFPGGAGRQLHLHVPHALRRSVLAELESSFGEQFATTRAAKLRSASDFSVTSFLYHHYALASGRAVSGNATSLIVRPGNIKNLLTSNNDLKYRFLCFNDGSGSAQNTAYKEYFQKYCERRLSFPSVLEFADPPSAAHDPQDQAAWFERLERVYQAAVAANEDEKRARLQEAAAVLDEIHDEVGVHEGHDLKIALWKFKYLNLLGRSDEAISLLARLAAVDPSFENTLKFYQTAQCERVHNYVRAIQLAAQISGSERNVKWVSAARVRSLLDRLRTRQIAEDVAMQFHEGRLSAAAAAMAYYHGNFGVQYSSQLAFELMEKLRSLSEMCKELGQSRKRLRKAAAGAASTPAADDLPIIFSSGFGYSGSGAVSDYLRCFSNVVEPRYKFDELVFLGGRHGIGSMYAILRALDKTSWEDFANRLTNFAFTAFLGLPFSMTTEGKAMLLRCTSSFVLDRSLLRFLTREEIGPASVNCDVLMARVIGMIDDLRAKMQQPELEIADFYTTLGSFCSQMLRYSGWRPGEVLLINNGVAADRLRVASLFPGAKFIVTARDPRDQFVSRVLEARGVDTGVAANVSLFSNRYSLLNTARKYHIKPANLAIVRFEDFVTDKALRERLKQFCGFDLGEYLTERGFFKPEVSVKNIGIHSTWPRQDDIQAVGKALLPRLEELSEFKFSSRTT